MKTWQLSGVCVLLALVIFQGVLIEHQSDQLTALQTQTSTLHAETLAKINAILVAQQHEQTILVAAFCANLRDVRSLAVKAGVPLEPLLHPKNAVGYTNVGGCRVAILHPGAQ